MVEDGGVAWELPRVSTDGSELQAPKALQALLSVHSRSFSLNSLWSQSAILQGFF